MFSDTEKFQEDDSEFEFNPNLISNLYEILKLTYANPIYLDDLTKGTKSLEDEEFNPVNIQGEFKVTDVF